MLSTFSCRDLARALNAEITGYLSLGLVIIIKSRVRVNIYVPEFALRFNYCESVTTYISKSDPNHLIIHPLSKAMLKFPISTTSQLVGSVETVSWSFEIGNSYKLCRVIITLEWH